MQVLLESGQAVKPGAADAPEAEAVHLGGGPLQGRIQFIPGQGTAGAIPGIIIRVA